MKKKNKWIPQLSDIPKKIKSNSWFNIDKYINEDNNDIPVIMRKSKKIIRSIPIRIYPDKNQSFILHQWFDLSRRMYNATTKFINKKIFVDGKLNLQNVNKYVNFHDLRSKYLINQKNNLCMHKINKHILDQSIARCVHMYKSCITKYKKGQIKDFRVKKIKKDKINKTILIEKSLF